MVASGTDELPGAVPHRRGRPRRAQTGDKPPEHTEIAAGGDENEQAIARHRAASQPRPRLRVGDQPIMEPPYAGSQCLDLHGIDSRRRLRREPDVTGDTSKDVAQTYHYPDADQPRAHNLTSVTTIGGTRDGQTDSGHRGHGSDLHPLLLLR